MAPPIRRRTPPTPPIFPLRIRVRNLALGGAVSVPITVSAVSEKPVTPSFVAGPGLAAADTTETNYDANTGMMIGYRISTRVEPNIGTSVLTFQITR